MSAVRSIGVACLAALLVMAALTSSPGSLPTVLDGDAPSAADDRELVPSCAMALAAASEPVRNPTFLDGPVLRPRTIPAEVFRPPQPAR